MHIHGYFFERTYLASTVEEIKAEREKQRYTADTENRASPSTSNGLQQQRETFVTSHRPMT